LFHGIRSFVVCAFCFAWLSSSSSAQEAAEFGGRLGIGALGSYSPTSQHILIGRAQGRKTTQAGFDYLHNLKSWSNIKFMYEGSVQPLYLESDPTILGTSTANVLGPPTINIFPEPYRPIGFPVYLGGIQTGSLFILNNPISGPNETTYAFAVFPVGLRLLTLTKTRIQPTFAINLGAVYATRNIPVDYTSSFNFLAAAGPGVEVFLDRRHSVRIEYLYEHLSNAGLGAENPGVDSGTFRLTVTRYK
jgi:hypothetical protein